MNTTAVCLILASVAGLAADHRQARIEWDPATLVLVQRGGVYARMARLQDGAILAIYERAAKVHTRRSTDEGVTWSDEATIAEYAHGNAANPEIVVLANGTVLAAYNERPARDSGERYGIRVMMSNDNAGTWSEPRLVFQAGTENGTGCWEPALLQLPTGEIHLYFANEFPFPETTEQEISLLRSPDLGETWTTEPERIIFRERRRDGMPVPLLLAGGKGIAVAIEDNGLSGAFKPVIAHTAVEDAWKSGAVDGASERRWSALEIPLAPAVYAGAPYLRQFPTGETVLSFQSGEGRARGNTLDFSRMAVYVGDSDARNFTSRSFPFDVPDDRSGLWNSLFIKNETTVTAISGTIIDGVRGIWAIDGKLRYEEQ